MVAENWYERIAEIGHVSDVWNVQPDATLRLLTSFYDTGKADDSLYKYEPMNFKVGLGFPLLAKLLLATGILLVVGIILGIQRLAVREQTIRSAFAHFVNSPA